MKKLLACGCSYTNINNLLLYPESESVSQPNHCCPDPTHNHHLENWPNYLASDLDLECINVGATGVGNDAIFYQAIKYISEYDHNDIEVICILWTQMFRVAFWNWSKYTDTINVFTHGCKDVGGADDIIYETAEKLLDKLKDRTWLDKFIYNYFKNISIITKLCKKLGIKLIMGQSIPFEPGAENGWADMCNSKYFFAKCADSFANTDINTKQFIGWPPIWQLGGYAMQDWNKPLFAIENRISETNYHPNTKGHRIIANEFLKKYKEIYK